MAAVGCARAALARQAVRIVEGKNDEHVLHQRSGADTPAHEDQRVSAAVANRHTTRGNAHDTKDYGNRF